MAIVVEYIYTRSAENMIPNYHGIQGSNMRSLSKTAVITNDNTPTTANDKPTIKPNMITDFNRFFIWVIDMTASEGRINIDIFTNFSDLF